MNKGKFSSIDLITLFLLIIVYAIVINFLIDSNILCAICSILFVIAYIICTVVDNLFENKKLNGILIIICFVLLILIVITFFI